MRNPTNRRTKIAVLLTALLTFLLLAQGVFAAPALAATNERDGSKIESIHIFWVTPDSAAANNGTATPQEILDDDTFLFLASESEAELEMKYQFEVAFSGQYDYAPGEIRITIPERVWHSRAYADDGNGGAYGVEDPDSLIGYIRMPIPEYPATSNDFAYVKMVDQYVITNTRTIGATSRATFQVSLCGLAPEDLVDMSLSDEITVNCQVLTNQGNIIELTSEPIRAQVDTVAKVIGAEKAGKIFFKNTAAQLPAAMAANLPAGANADDYYYVRWNTHFYHRANQPFSMQLEDVPDTVFEYVLDENGDYVLDADGNRLMDPMDVEPILLGVSSHSGAQLSVNAEGKPLLTVDTLTNTYVPSNNEPYITSAVVWTAYPKDQFPPIPESYDVERYYWFPNAATWTMIETDIDPANPEGFAAAADGQLVTTQSASALERLRDQWLREPEEPGWPEEIPVEFELEKWTEREGYKDYDYGYGINYLLENEEAEMTFLVHTEGHGYALTKEPGAENTVENYGKLGWRQTVEDFDTFWEESDVPLTEEDFHVVSIRIPDPTAWVYGKWKEFNEIIQDWEWHYGYVTDPRRPIPDLEVEYQVAGSGEWLKAGVARWGSDGVEPNTGFSFEEATAGISFDNASQTVIFPADTTDVRYSYVSNVFGGTTMAGNNYTAGWEWDVYFNINLKPSDRVRAMAEFLFNNVEEIDSEFRNDALMYVDAYVRANPDGTPDAGQPYGPTEYSYSEASIMAGKYGVVLDKQVTYNPNDTTLGGDNDVVNQRVALHYTAKLTEATNLEDLGDFSSAVSSGAIPRETKGVFYDLLPEGVYPDLDTITMSKGEVVTNKYIIDNYKNSGRILMVVEVDMTPTLTLSSKNGFNSSNKMWVQDNAEISFVAYAPWDIIGDEGVNLTNYIAFETKIDDLYRDALGSVAGRKGEPDDPRGGMNVTTPDMPDDIALALTDLDPTTDECRFVYAEAEVNLSVVTQMLNGYRKDVRDPLVSGKWTQGLLDQEQVTVYEGHPYIYRLRLSNGGTTEASNIIFYDTIENYHIPDPAGSDATKQYYFEAVEGKKDWKGDWENKGQWRGKLASVDLRDFIAKGAAPVLYYSTVPDLQFDDTDLPVNSPTAEDFFNTGSYVVSDTTIWQKAQLDENGQWVVPDELYGTISAVAVDARKTPEGTDFVLPKDASLQGLLNMIAPDDDMDPDTWNAKGAYARVEGTTDQVDWELAAQSPENNMYAYNNTRVKYVQHALDQTGAESSYMMIRNDFVRVGILPRTLYLSKQWQDEENWDGIRPGSVTFALERRTDGVYAPVLDASGSPVTVTLTEENGWAAQLLQMDIVDENNIPYQYRFVEQDVPEGYTCTVMQEDLTHYTATNTHELYTLPVSGEKRWNDEDDLAKQRPESITVHLLRDGERIGQQIVTPDADGNWTYNFGTQPMYAEGGRPYVYTVEEDYVPRYLPSSEDYTLLVNDYYPYGDLQVEKQVEGTTDASAAAEFEFALTLMEEETEEMRESGKKPQPLLDEFAYKIFTLGADGTWLETEAGTKTGCCTFRLRGGQRFVFYDLPHGATYKVQETPAEGFSLTTIENNNGTILSGDCAEVLFVNTYSAAGQVPLSVGKNQQGAGMSNNQHKFELTDMNPGSPTYGQVIGTAYSGTAESQQTQLGEAILSEATASFGMLSYTLADHGQTFTYQVSEVDLSKPGYDYDANTYLVFVTVTDNGDGTLSVTAVDENGNDLTAQQGEGITFNNTYSASGEHPFRAWKRLLNRDLQAGEFSFELYRYDPAAEAPVGQPLQTVANDADGNILFDAIAFTQDDVSLDENSPAKYYFLVKEKVGDDATVIYSEEKFIYELTVRDNKNGTLSFEETVHAETADGAAALPVFTNDLQPGKLSVEKIAAEGGDRTQPFTFKVKLIGEGIPQYVEGELSGTPVPPTPTPEPTPVPTIEPPATATPSPTHTAPPTPAPTEVPGPTPTPFKGKYTQYYYATEEELKGNPYARLDLQTGELVIFRAEKIEGSNRRMDPDGNLFSTGPAGNYHYFSLPETVPQNHGYGKQTFWNVKDKVTSIRMAGAYRPVDLYRLFGYMKNLKTADLSLLDTSLTTDMNGMFSGSGLAELDASGWDTGNVTDMSYLFSSCDFQWLDLSNWDTGSVTNMYSMFNGNGELLGLDLSGWDTSNVTSMGGMFEYCRKLDFLDASGWDVSKVENMENMFRYCNALRSLDLTGWDPAKVTIISQMFYDCFALTGLDLSSWNTSSLKEMRYVFGNCYVLDGLDLSGWDTSNVTLMPGVFSNCRSLKALDLSSWDTGKVEYFYSIFENCYSLTELDVSSWDLSSALWLSDAFEMCCSLTELDVSNWDTFNVTKMDGMFSGCYKLAALDVSGWDTGNVELMDEMFRSCENLTALDVTGWDTSNVTATWDMFHGCVLLTDVDVSGWNVPKLANASGMFYDCRSITEMDLSGWRTNVKYIDDMFSGCTALTKADLSNWGNTQLIYASRLFQGCISLEEANVEGLIPGTAKYIDYMFDGCWSLTSLDLSSWDVSGAENIYYMFRNCLYLTELDVSGWQLNEECDSLDRMFQNCQSLTSLDLSSWNVKKILWMERMFQNCRSLTELNLNNWDTDSLNSNDFAFYGVDNLQKVTIGRYTVFPADGLYPYPQASSESPYCGEWILESRTGYTYTSDELFTSGYKAGTWVLYTNAYTLNFLPGEGAAGAMPSVIVPRNSAYAFKHAFYRPGYVVSGFSDGRKVYPCEGGITNIPAYSYSANANVTLTAQWKERDTTFEVTDNEFTVELFAGETYTFANLPAGTAYQVMEQVPSGWLLVKQENASGEIQPLITSNAVFTNRRSDGSVQVFLAATKLMDGVPAKAEAFSFSLTDPSGDVVEVVKNSAGGAVRFAPITFTREDLGTSSRKTFQYKITEEGKSNFGPISYDWTTYTAVITLEDKGGLLTASVIYKDGSYQEEPVFTNKTAYANLRFSKTVPEEGLTDAAKEQEFTFQVTFRKADHTPWTGSASGKVYVDCGDTYGYRDMNADGTILITLKAGEKALINAVPAGVSYQLREIGSLPGWQMDGTVAEGTLAPGANDTYIFENTYSTKGVANIAVSKELTGRPLEAGEFTFLLKDENGDLIGTATNDADGNVVFDTLHYTAEGTYTYTVTEQEGGDPTVSYSGEEIGVTVTMTDETGKGSLTAKVEYTNDDRTITNTLVPGSLCIEKQVVSPHAAHQEQSFTFTLTVKDAEGNPLSGEYPLAAGGTLSLTDGEGTLSLIGGESATIGGLPHGSTYTVTEAEASGFTAEATGAEGTISAAETAEAVFTNTYAAKGEHRLYAAKTLNGAALAEGQFAFTLCKVNEDGTETLVETVRNDAEGKVAFSKFLYTERDAGTYVYRIAEVSDGQTGILYDKTVREVTLTVTDDLCGTMQVAQSVTGGDDLTFVNEYSNETSVTATKQWLGDEEHPTTRTDILVSLYRKLPGQSGELVEQKLIPADATGAALTVGWEQLPKFADVDGAEVEIQYYVTEEMADADAPYNGRVTNAMDGGFLLVNRYGAAEVPVEAFKTVENHALAAEQFTFRITDGAGETVAEAKNAADGTVAFPALTYTAADLADVSVAADGSRTKTLSYIISEVDDGQPGYTYDAAEYPFTVTLWMDAEGNLTAECDLEADAAQFTNTYSAAGQWSPEAAKTVNGDTPKEHEVFTFLLTDADGNELQRKHNTAGAVAFDAIAYTEADAGKTFTYHIHELAEERPGYTMDTTLYTAAVTVSDDHDGTLTAAAVYTVPGEAGSEPAVAEAVTFDNRYEAYGDIGISAKKLVNGAEPLAHHTYLFLLKDEQGQVLQRKENERGAITFDDLTYTEADAGKTFVYTVSEVESEDALVTGDATVYTVTVTVTDLKNGKLDVQKIITDHSGAVEEILFRNTLTTPLTISKQVEGVETDEHFTVTVTLFHADGTEAEGTYAYTGAAEGDLVSGGTIAIADGETVTIHGLLPGMTALVEEEVNIAYTTAVNGTAGNSCQLVLAEDGNTVAFVNTFKRTAVSVTKHWDDAEDAAGKRPESITVSLEANGEAVESVTLTPDGEGNWAHTFENLPCYEAGAEIVYTVAEAAVEGYAEPVYAGSMAEGFTITNRYAAGEVTIPGTKKLLNRSFAEGDSFTFTLCEGEAVLETITLEPTEGSSAAFAFAPIPYTLSDVGEHVYTVAETAGDAEDMRYDGSLYTVTVTVADAGSNTLTVTPVITVDGQAAEAIVFTNEQLTRLTLSKQVEGTETDRSFVFTVTLWDAEGNELAGEYPWTLYTADESGAETALESGVLSSGDPLMVGHDQYAVITGLTPGCTYQVEESAAIGYDTAVNGQPGSTAEGTLALTGNHVAFVNTFKTVGFSVTKRWEGGSGPIELTIYANGKKMEPQPVIVRTGDVYSVSGLPMYDALGLPVTYAAKEKYFDGFLTIYSNVAPHASETDMIYNGGTIINRKEKEVSFRVRKVWKGLPEGETAPAITLVLYCNGEPMDVPTPKPNRKGWYNYYDLPDEVNGVPAVYTVQEVPVPGYATAYEDAKGNPTENGVNNGTIYNTLIPTAGDATPLAAFAVLMLLSGAGLAVLLRRRKRL